MTAARIVLADEDALFRTALAVVLRSEGYDVVGQANTAAEAQELLALPPDLVLASRSLPVGTDPFQPSFPAPAPRLIVLGPSCEHEHLVAALEAGAQGYSGKDVGLPELLRAIAAVLRGEAFVLPSMLGGLLHELVQRSRRATPASALTPLSRREQEVLELLALGHGQSYIAKALVISPQTARTHIQKLIGKLGVHSRGEAVAVALQHGLVATS